MSGAAFGHCSPGPGFVSNRGGGRRHRRSSRHRDWKQTNRFGSFLSIEPAAASGATTAPGHYALTLRLNCRCASLRPTSAYLSTRSSKARPRDPPDAGCCCCDAFAIFSLYRRIAGRRSARMMSAFAQGGRRSALIWLWNAASLLGTNWQPNLPVLTSIVAHLKGAPESLLSLEPAHPRRWQLRHTASVALVAVFVAAASLARRLALLNRFLHLH